MALTKDTERESMVRNDFRIDIELTGGSHYYQGALINLTASGLGVKAGDVAGQTFAGVLEEGYDATGGNTKARVVKDDKMWIPLATAAQSDMHRKVFAIDDDTVAFSAVNVPACGVVVGVRPGVAVLVDFAKAEVV